jgi:type VI secretion system protein ImpK
LKTIGAPIVETLPDVAADLLSFAQQLVKTGDPGDPEAFRLKVDELFKAFESRGKQLEHNDDNIALAKYALVAFIDEIILTSGWPLRDAWSGRPLQLEYFNDFSAGEVFYDKLDSIRGTDNPKKLEVLEIYHSVLALGFKGKYADLSGMEKIKTLMEGMARDLHKWRSKGVQGLSPNWKCTEDPPKLVQQFPIWIVPVACLALLLVAYITLAWILGGTVSDLKAGLGLTPKVN